MPRLSFTLRDVFWLTLVVGMGVGWWVDAGRQRWRANLLDRHCVFYQQYLHSQGKQVAFNNETLLPAAVVDMGPVGQP